MKVSHLLGAGILSLGLVPQCKWSPAPSANSRGATTRKSESSLVHLHPLIQPPFVRKWTQLVGEQAFVVAVRERVIYYCSHTGVGALDLATGRRKWSSLSPIFRPK